MTPEDLNRLEELARTEEADYAGDLDDAYERGELVSEWPPASLELPTSTILELIALARAPQTPTDDGWRTIETGWLIEAFDSRTHTYQARWLAVWTAMSDEDDREEWVSDSNAAIRFARREDAERVISDIGWTEARATEHRWGS